MNTRSCQREITAPRCRYGSAAFCLGKRGGKPLSMCRRKSGARRFRRAPLRFSGAPGPIRTADTRFRRAVLCPLSYWGAMRIVAHKPSKRGISSQTRYEARLSTCTAPAGRALNRLYMATTLAFPPVYKQIRIVLYMRNPDLQFGYLCPDTSDGNVVYAVALALLLGLALLLLGVGSGSGMASNTTDRLTSPCTLLMRTESVTPYELPLESLTLEI